MGEARSVVKKGPVISASQLDLYHNQCQRRWGLRYLARLSEPPSRGRSLGTLCHWWLENAISIREGIGPVGGPEEEVWETAGVTGEKVEEITRGALPYFAAGVVPEQSFSLDLPGTEIPLVGKIDGWHRTSPTQETVYDLKTCKSFGYIKSALELQTDFQGMIYPATAFLTNPSLENVLCHWVYVKTAKDRDLKAYPSPSLVSWYCSRAAHESNWQKVIDKCEPLVHLYHQRPDPLTLPPNSYQCDKYGGCPFREHCEGGTTVEKSLSNTQEILEYLRSRAPQSLPAEEGEQPPVVEVTPAPVEVPIPPTPSPAASLQAEIEARVRAQDVQVEQGASETPIPAESSPPPAASKPPRRGRPKGSRTKKAAPTETPPPAAPPPPSPTPPAVETPEETPAVTAERTLYINCAPVGEKVHWVFELPQFEFAEQKVLEGAKAPWELVDFGKGSGMLLAEFSKVLPTIDVPAIRLSTSLKPCQVVGPLLMSKWATRIVVAGG